MKTRSRHDPSVTIRGLNHAFGHAENRKQVLFDNNLELFPGEMITMTGPSGSGKTTLLTVVGALRGVQEGTANCIGHELNALSPLELVEFRRKVGFIFQAHNLFDSLSAMENVNMAIELGKVDAAERNRRSAEMLTKVGLGHRLHNKPQALSGGQRQRVAIARALVNQPKLILADEPTAALDKEAGREVVTLLRDLAEKNGSTILLVTHDSRVLEVADRLVNMIDGRIVSDFAVKRDLRICEFLRRCPLFAEESPTRLAEFARPMQTEFYDQGEVVFAAGTEADKFFLVAAGSVEVVRPDSAGLRIVLEAGQFFGEVALLTGGVRNATIIAREPVELYAMSKTQFNQVRQRNLTFEQLVREAMYSRR